MRSAALVLIAYAVMVVLGVVWPVLPLGPLREVPPDIAALTAGYLGLTARRGLAGAVAAAVITGYLADLLAGTPPGLLALVAGLTCVLGHLVQRRILVRGWAVVGFAAGVGAVAALLSFLVRLAVGQPIGGLRELAIIVMIAATTSVFGPLLLRLYRRVDAAFARTHREREHALEGLVS
jgi:cell shape-determining protein MreD